MLDTLYKQKVKEDDSGNLIVTSDSNYQVSGYSEVHPYTLVFWEQSVEDESFTGETLWRGKTPIATGGGALDLYVVDVKQNSSKEVDVVEKTNSLLVNNVFNFGLYAVPKQVALALRNPKNIIIFDLN